MDNKDLLSIAECARRLGLHRPKVSTLVKKHALATQKKGNETLVSFSEVQRCVQMEAATGGVRSPNIRKEIQTDDGAIRKVLEEQIRDLKETNKELKTENTKLRERVDTLVHVETELKLLKAGVSEPTTPKSEAETRKGASATVDIKKRASKALNALLGKE